MFRELTRDECETMLARNHVARLAFSFRDRVDIAPIHYVYEDGELVIRTSPGTKLEMLSHHPWAALEIDEVQGIFDWRSVVAHGPIYPVEDGPSDAHRELYESALAKLRRLIPEALTAADPVPHRTVLLRFHIDRMTGRASAQGPEPERP